MMESTDQSTIFALSSAAGRAGVAVIRVSGAGARAAVEALTGRAVPQPRMARLDKLRDADGLVIDEALVLWFPAPNSFTGEDCAEFQCHGGPAVVTGVLERLGHIAGLAPAGPGDFTRRAVEHGKMDLTQAEGLIDLIHAETAAQRRQALRQKDGALGVLYDGWRERLIRALAYAEAEIDFPDEGDVPDGLIAAIRPTVDAVLVEIGTHLNDAHRGERLRDGISIVLLGPPNAGKSTLLNALARRDVAIVSDIAGTTRDTLDVALDLGGVPVVLTDTAGLRQASDAIEAEGVRRARARAAQADLRVMVLDGQDPAMPDGENADYTLYNKADLITADRPDKQRRTYALSAKTGLGLDRFLSDLTTDVVARFGAQEAPALTRVRHRQALERCQKALDQSLSGVDDQPELVAEDLRDAVQALGSITGRVDVEDLLDVVFRDFCVGK